MCKLCEIKPVYEFTNKQKLCKTCYIRWFQKKFLYTLRRFNMINKGDVIGYRKGKGFREVVLEDVLKMYAEKGHVRLTSGNKYSKFALASTSDTETYGLISELFKGKIKIHKPVEGKIIKPLYLFLDKEVFLYAKLINLKFKKVNEKKNKLNMFIDELEKKHPELKQAVVKGLIELK